jgi:transcriptional regulator with PAS, ATPase and Fis domain
VKARLISATNKDLKGLVDQGRFRDDLYYRLKVIQIDLPTLKERREDLPLLIEHLIRKLNLQTGKKIAQVSPKALEVLMNYNYPGNIRELENILEHAFVLCHGSLIQFSHLPPELQREPQLDLPTRLPSGQRLKDQEGAMIRKVLEKNQGHRARTARELGIHPTTLWRKLKDLS